MAESLEHTKTNGETKERNHESVKDDADNVVAVVKGLIWSIFCPEPISDLSGTSFLYRTKTCLRRDFPKLRDSSRTAGYEIFRWSRGGSPLRSLLVLSVGGVSLVTLTGLLVFSLFFVAATFNAVVISLLLSLAAAGGFLAIFFSCIAVIYIGALSVALFAISVSTISVAVVVLVMAGWIGFLWTIWLGLTKSASLAKHTIGITGSAITAYTARHAHRPGHNHHHD